MSRPASGQALYLVQLLLPTYDAAGQPIPREQFRAVRAELTERFGGLTVYSRSPAEGLWQDDDEQTRRDDVILFEIMVETLDREFWSNYRQQLEARFGQEEIVARAQEMTKL